MKLSLITPVYNEEKSLENMVMKVIASLKDISYEMILVDDGSSDKSLEIMKKLAKKYSHISAYTKEHSGKTQTVKYGILKSKGKYVVIQDADTEYDPMDIVSLLKYLEKNKLDVVYGNRFGKKNKVIYSQNWIGNTALSFISGIFTGIRSGMFPRDMEVCYKLANGDMFREIGKTIECTTNFGFEPEVTAKFAKIPNVKFGQLPISYYPRTVKEGKKMKAIKNGLEALKEIIYFNLIK